MPLDWPEAGAQPPASGTVKEEEAMALKPYKVTVDGHETTLLLSDEDAKRQGLLKDAASADAAPAKKAAAPRNKARKTTANKAK